MEYKSRLMSCLLLHSIDDAFSLLRETCRAQGGYRERILDHAGPMPSITSSELGERNPDRPRHSTSLLIAAALTLECARSNGGCDAHEWRAGVPRIMYTGIKREVQYGFRCC